MECPYFTDLILYIFNLIGTAADDGDNKYDDDDDDNVYEI